MSVNPNDPDQLVAALGGFGASTNIVETTGASSASGTGSFSSIQGNLPAMPVFDAVIDKDDANYIIAGTAFGLYYTQDGGSTWSSNNDEIGRVPVFRVSQDAEDVNVGTDFEGAIYLSTHGRGYWSTNKHLLIDLVGVEEIEDEKIEIKSKLDIFPNPVNDLANVAFETGNTSNVSIAVVDLQGKVIQSKDLGKKPAGKHRVNLNTQDLPSGMYLIKVTAGKSSKTGKFIKM